LKKFAKFGNVREEMIKYIEMIVGEAFKNVKMKVWKANDNEE
jgi:hypothetical protein